NADINPQSKGNKSKVNETRVSSSRSSIDIHSENIAESYWLNQVNPAEAPMVLESIRFWVNDFQGQDEIVIMAIEEMLKNGAKNYNYLDRVLKNWENKQLDTVEKVRKYLQGHYSKSPRNANKTLEYEKFSTDELPI
ncbi:TPA: DnaD domain-containing protein, partial [Enterococcus hirae]|nr:DnaD domain protein [Enterococcus hirae]EMF0439479.1 DnaD domain protein [Enterococcus hirae]